MLLWRVLLTLALSKALWNLYRLRRNLTLLAVLEGGAYLGLVAVSWQLLSNRFERLPMEGQFWLAFYSLILALRLQEAMGGRFLRRLVVGGFSLCWVGLALWPQAVFKEIHPAGSYHEFAYGRLGEIYLAGWLIQIIILLLALESLYLRRNYSILLATGVWIAQLIGVGLMIAYFYPRSDVLTLLTVLLALLEIQPRWELSPQDAPVWTLSQEFVGKLYIPALIGAYLMALGGIQFLAQALGWRLRWVDGVLIALALLIILIGILLWPSLRRRYRYFVARHFYATQYDYRSLWEEVSNELFLAQDAEQLFHRIAHTIAEILGVRSVALYHLDERRRMQLTYSTTEGFEVLPPLGEWNLDWLWRLGKPYLLSSRIQAPLREEISALRSSGVEILLPVNAGGKLSALILIGVRDNRGYTLEDLQVLETLMFQIGIVMHNLQLNETLVIEHELSSIARMTTFILHDLKNAAAMLSLVQKNASANWENPRFREDMLITLQGIQERIQRVIQKFGPSAQDDLQLSKVDVAALLEDTLQNPGLRAKESLSVALRASDRPQLLLDRERIKSVFLNLLLNASEAIGESPGRIEIRLWQTEDDAILEIEDDGPGIPSAFLTHRLFKPFQTTKPKGLGIGLYQCKTIIEAHGGVIEIHSEEGVGTTVHLEFPQ